MNRLAIFVGIILVIAASGLENGRNRDCCRFPGGRSSFAEEISAGVEEAAAAAAESSQEDSSEPQASVTQPEPTEKPAVVPTDPAGNESQVQPEVPSDPAAQPQMATDTRGEQAASEVAKNSHDQPEVASVAQEVSQPSAGQSSQPAVEAESETQSLKPSLAEILAKLRPEDPEKYLKIGEICQVKVHRLESLHGLGLVVDLAEFAKALGTSARGGSAISSPIGSALGLPATGAATPSPGRPGVTPAVDVKAILRLLDQAEADDPTTVIPEILWERRAVALVAVTVTLPAEGIRKGERLDCQIRSFEPRNIAGGYLLPTKLFPPGPREGEPLGIAAGPVVSESSFRSAGDKVLGGCVVQADITEQFLQDGKLRLVLRPEHSGFLVAQEVADRINLHLGLLTGKPLAKALSPSTIEVELPAGFEDNPVGFISQLLRLPSNVPIAEAGAPSVSRPVLPKSSR